jgi:hypothetical protein
MEREIAHNAIAIKTPKGEYCGWNRTRKESIMGISLADESDRDG